MRTRGSLMSIATMLATAGLLAAGIGGYRLATPDRILASGYGTALADIDTSWGARHAGNLWLSSAPAGRPFAAAEPAGGRLAVGDRITIAARAGGQQAIEIVRLEDLDGDGLGLPGLHVQIVTGRALDGTDATVRFMFSVDTPDLPPPAAPRDRSL